jgi:trehalose 6-phosphate phosphatase
MRYLLARDNQEVLVQLAASRVVLVFDFDGTLAPIVACRDEAGMRPETGYLLTRICELYPSAVISGRSRPDVTSRLGGAHLRRIVGNHGLEPGWDLPEVEHEVQRAGWILRRAFSELPGST